MKMAIKRLAQEILSTNAKLSDLVLVGIKTRGEFLAKRLSYYIKLLNNSNVPYCSLDISYYRDDIDNRNLTPVQPALSFTNKNIILVDDVLYSGRSIRAALAAVFATGRPKNIQLAVLIDRGHRELPFKADYIGKNIPTTKDQWVSVKMKEYDGEDRVYLKE